MTRTTLVTVNVHGVGPEAASAPEEELFGRLGLGRYTYRIGLARMLDSLRRSEIKATFFWPVFEAERCRALLERCLADGHEVASNGLAFEDHIGLGDREDAVLERAHSRLAALCGTAPVGFRAPTGTLSDRTIPILQRLGYRYDSSFIDDDAPYPLDGDGGAGMVELPVSQGLTDATHFGQRLTQSRAEAFMIEAWDALLATDGYACLTLHPRADLGVGRAARITMIERLFERARGLGSEFRQCREVAAEAGRQFGSGVPSGAA